MTDKYTCAACKEEFDTGWIDEEATTELAQTFPGVAKEDCSLVCDDCYKKMGLG